MPLDLDLGGIWSLAQQGGNVQTPCTLPGDAISALVSAEVLPEPYVGTNEFNCRWVAETDWVLTREFDLDDPSGHWVLEIDGLDAVAQVSINGHMLLEAANSFRLWRVVVPSDLLHAGENRIEIAVFSSLEEAKRRAAAQPFPVPFQAENCPLPHGNMLRKPECDFGWDWNIALAPFGVTGHIKLCRVTTALPRPIRVTQRHEPGCAHVCVHIQTDQDTAADPAAAVRYKLQFAGEVREGIAEVEAVEHFTVTDPDLWWPNGWGAQALYDLTLTLDGRTIHHRIGLRSIELTSEIEPDGGRSFGLRVNGHAHFSKGANWIPADALVGRIDRAAVRDLLTSARDAHMTMIRVWGGGRYEPDWFYDMCDELGLMVWQDAMFACHLYPCDAAFLAEIHAEVAEQAERLQHHACLALWCGDNELVGALTWYPESRADRDRYLVAYDRLNRTVEDAVRAGDPDANWWPSSPSPGPLAFSDAWHDDRAGDMHFWSVWHEGRDFDHYRDVTPRFCSEFGFQSYPSMDVIRRFAEPRDRNIGSLVMEHHQRNKGGNARIAETMFRYFRWPEAFEDFVWLSQLQQGLAIETAVSHWRSLSPRCQGTLYWQLNDTWPCCSWSSLDHGGGWKLTHYMARRFYAPVAVAAVPEGANLSVRGVSDLREAVDLNLNVRALAMSGASRDLGRTTTELQPNTAAELLRLPKAAWEKDEVLVLDWDGPHPGRAIHAPRPWKTYELPSASLSPEVTAEEAGWRLDITAQSPVFFATAEADIPGRWSDAAIPVLLPGESFSFRFRPGAETAPEFTLRDLASATL